MTDDTAHWREQAVRFRRRRAWRNFAVVFLRNHPLCEDHKAMGRLKPATEVDHAEVPLWRRLRDEENCFDRLAGLCAACHQRRTNAEKAGKAPPTITGLDGWPAGGICRDEPD